MNREEPFISIFFKGISALTGLIALFVMATGGAGGMVTGAYLLLGAAPFAWWMGSVIDLLDRIANGASAPGPAVKPSKPAKVESHSQTSSSKIFKDTSGSDDGSGVPTIRL